MSETNRKKMKAGEGLPAYGLSSERKRVPPPHAFKKGDPKPPGSGRQPGQRNKITLSVKKALEEAFDKLGGVDALVKWGRLNQTDFYRLWSRMLPLQVSGPDGGPIVFQTKHDLSKLSIDELSQLANLVEKATITRAMAGEQVGATDIVIPAAASEDHEDDSDQDDPCQA